MKVLVTGLEGFTGKYLKDELASAGHTVIGLKSDLTDISAINHEVKDIHPDAVVHLGAISFVATEDINQLYQVNLLGTRNLLAALFHYASYLQSIILVSTGNVYGNSAEGKLSELSLVKPANDYAVSKLAMEHMAYLWMDKLPICITRPFNYTGVGQSDQFLIPKIVSHFKMKKPVIELGNLDVAREFGDVRVVSSMYRKLLEKKLTNETVNICTGKAYTLQDVISMCEEMTGHSIEVCVNPAFVRANEVSVLVGDNAKLKSIVGDLGKTDLKETLQWMLSV